jgi:hypothetical protein
MVWPERPVPVRPVLSTPPEPFLARFFRSEIPVFGTKKPHPLPQPAGGVVIFGTLQGATGGTQTHSRRTGSKLGRLHRARQGLVRVSESNTKYGGKGRITGGGPHLRCCQVSVSPQGFPSEKKLFGGIFSGFVPLFTGQLFIVGEDLPREDSRDATEKCRAVDMAFALWLHESCEHTRIRGHIRDSYFPTGRLFQ